MIDKISQILICFIFVRKCIRTFVKKVWKELLFIVILKFAFDTFDYSNVLLKKYNLLKYR